MQAGQVTLSDGLKLKSELELMLMLESYDIIMPVEELFVHLHRFNCDWNWRWGCGVYFWACETSVEKLVLDCIVVSCRVVS